MIARVINVLLGLALAGTALLWEPAGSPVYWHDLVVGLAIAGVSLLAIWVPWLTYIDTALGLWLFLSGMFLPVVPHIYIGIVTGTLVFIFSMVSTRDRTFWPWGPAPAGS
jgi:hypothetical protein